VAAGFSVGVFYLFAAILAWQLSGLPAATLALMRGTAWAFAFACRHHGCELEVPLYHTHCFLNRDYIMFDCSGMAFSESGFYASIAIGSERCQTAPLPTRPIAMSTRTSTSTPPDARRQRSTHSTVSRNGKPETDSVN